jgi:hypothetical protein
MYIMVYSIGMIREGEQPRTEEKTMTNQVDLYGEDGIKIGLTQDYDIVAPDSDEAIVVVTGYALYCRSLEEAQRSIRREYLDRFNILDPYLA